MAFVPEALLKSWSEELTSKANRVRHLIGDKHWATDGAHKEKLLRDFISKFTAERFTIGGGFVLSDSISQKCSTEVDILISDFQSHPPLFNEGGVQIIPAESLVAHLEVKSTFEKTSLTKALKAIARTQDVLVENQDTVWRGIAFASCPESRDLDSFLETLCHSIAEIHSNKAKLKDSDLEVEIHSGTLPICIATFSSFVAFLRKGQERNEIVVNVFEVESLGVSILINDLLIYLREHCGKCDDSELSKIMETLPIKNKKQKTLELTNK